ncbi:hypothetical protein [Laspinema palackyanum]|uniref:hypothetical protein n=1 Tax=Laspinema palackyanum TaxID=3231601 RepID=UPI00349F6BA2
MHCDREASRNENRKASRNENRKASRNENRPSLGLTQTRCRPKLPGKRRLLLFVAT